MDCVCQHSIWPPACTMNWRPLDHLLNLFGSPVFFLHFSLLVSSVVHYWWSCSNNITCACESRLSTKSNEWMSDLDLLMHTYHPLLSRMYNSYLIPWWSDPPSLLPCSTIVLVCYHDTVAFFWALWLCSNVKGLTVTRKLNHAWYILYSRKYWWELNLAVRMAIAKILADLNLAAR